MPWNGTEYVTMFFKLPSCHFVSVLVVRSGGGNMVAIDLIVQHVHSQLEEVRRLAYTHTHTACTHACM